MRSTLLAVLVSLSVVPHAQAGECSQSRDPAFYEARSYRVRTIEFRSPFSFFFLVRQRFNAIRSGLPVTEGGLFDRDAYDASFVFVSDAVKADGALGQDSPIKLVVTTGSIENCQESGSGSTLDIVYRVFSTDPIPAIQASPEQRQSAAERPATTAGEQTTVPNYKVVPRFGYDRTRRGFGGMDVSLRIPVAHLDEFHLSAEGSSSSRAFFGGLRGSGSPKREGLDQLEYEVAYSYDDAPALGLRLTKGVVHGRFTGSSKPLEFTAGRVLFRYGAAIEEGNQQTNRAALSSAYGALKFYGGLANTTRYSESAVSYGIAFGGRGLSNLTYARHFADAMYRVRFPKGTNVPWDLAVRATAGGITNSREALINDRFFGGNTVVPLVPGGNWDIPTGPLVRSIPMNRLTGNGLGGTSFYSVNLTAGKVIKGWPLIPAEVERAPGFDQAVNFAENTAQTWFMDDYEAESPAFKKILEKYPSKLKADLDAAVKTVASIRASGSVNAAVKATLLKADLSIKVSEILVENALDPTLRGPARTVPLRAWLLPNSALVKVSNLFRDLETLTPTAAPELKAIGESITGQLGGLRTDLNAIQNGPDHDAAMARAKKDLERPREVIDTLRHETNRYSISVVGIADAGRVWPDRYGTRYALGGGARFSLVNVNFTLGYAVNPQPRRELGQGRGALFFSVTYTNLFR